MKVIRYSGLLTLQRDYGILLNKFNPKDYVCVQNKTGKMSKDFGAKKQSIKQKSE